MDELNAPKVFDFEEYIDEYFKPMQLNKKELKERKEASRDLFNLLLFIFALIGQGYASEQYIIDQFNYELRSIAMQYGDLDPYYDSYVDMAVNNIMTTTMAHLGAEEWLSPERAGEIAVNEANTILNYKELIDAKANGYTSKTWKAEKDTKVRKSHVKMDGKTIPIDDYFVFPDCHVLIPRDEVNGSAKQVVNCRCMLSFGNATVFDSMEPTFEDFKVKVNPIASKKSMESERPFIEVPIEEYQNFSIQSGKPVETRGVFNYLGEIYKVGAYEKDGIKYRISFEPDAREREVAQLLIDKLGGVVQLMPKFNSPQNVRCPDFMFRGKRFDLKGLENGKSSQLLYDKIKPKKNNKGEKTIQAENYIFDIRSEEGLSLREILSQAKGLYSNPRAYFVQDIIIMKNKEILKILSRI